MSPRSDLPKGQLVAGRHRVEHKIGEGAMGAVYRAFDEHMRRAVALKVILLNAGPGPEERKARARLEREARAAARLNHPHVVTIYDYGTDPVADLDFIVMKLLDGIDLKTRLAREGRLPPGLAVRIFTEAAWGLGAGHVQDMVHRDVKPANIFLERVPPRAQVCARVLDFGIVQVAYDDDETQLTRYGATPQSPGYASPEQLRGSSELEATSDVFSLGVTLFQALTGELPFSTAARNRIRDGADLPAPSARDRFRGVPAALDEVIRTALAPRPTDRFADGNGFAEALLAAARSRRPHGDEGATRTLPRPDRARGNPRARAASPPPAAPPGPGLRARTPRSKPTDPAGSAASTYPPLTFWTDSDEEVVVRDPAHLADLLELSPRRGRKFLYERYAQRAWGDVNQGLCLALSELVDETYPTDRDAGLVAAAYLLDARRPYRAHGEAHPTYAGVAADLLLYESEYRSGLRQRTHPLWIYLQTRRSQEVRDGVEKHAAAFAAAEPPQEVRGATASAALNRLVLWLRGLDGITSLPFHGGEIAAPAGVLELDGDGQAEAAAWLVDGSSLFSLWIEVHWPDLLPLVKRWRAAHLGDAARLRYALGGGVPVGPGEIRSSIDAFYGPPGVVAALWDGGGEVRAEVDTYLATYHHWSLVRAAFEWLNSGDTSHADGFEVTPSGTASPRRPPHPDRSTVKEFVAEHLAELVEQLFHSPFRETAYIGYVERTVADTGLRPPGEHDASWNWDEAAPQRSRLDILMVEVAPTLLRGVRAPAGFFASADQRVIDSIVNTAAALLEPPETAGELRLVPLAAWLHTAAQALAHAEAYGAEAWRHLVERMDDILLGAYRQGVEEMGSDPLRSTFMMEILRESVESLSAQGVRLTLIERLRSEEEAYSKLAHVVRGRTDAMRRSALAAADAKAAAAAEEKRAAAARRANVSDALSRVRLSWLEVAFLLLGGVLFLYGATDLWDLLAEAARHERPLDSGATGVWAVLEVLADSTRGMRWALFKAYLPLLVFGYLASMAAFLPGIESADHGTVGCGSAGLALLGTAVLTGGFPHVAVALVPVLTGAVIAALVWRWLRAQRLRGWIARELAAVEFGKEQEEKAAGLRTEAARGVEARIDQQLLDIRRSLAAAAAPSAVAAPPEPPAAAPELAARRWARAVRGWRRRNPGWAAAGVLVGALVLAAAAVNRTVPVFWFRVLSREAYYVAVTGNVRYLNEHQVRRIAESLRDDGAKLLEIRDDDGDVVDHAAAFGPYGEARARRVWEEKKGNGYDMRIINARDLGQW